MANRVILVRHGETEWSEERRHTGRSDITLTLRGRAQAAHIAAAVARLDIDMTLTSPLSRARETAELAGLDPTPDDDLVEWDYGDYEGRTTADIQREDPGWSVWTHPILGGESIEQVATRSDHVIARLQAVEGTVAIVAHAHLLRILTARWLGFAPVAGQHLVLDTATISVLGWERETAAILRWNLPADPA